MGTFEIRSLGDMMPGLFSSLLCSDREHLITCKTQKNLCCVLSACARGVEGHQSSRGQCQGPGHHPDDQQGACMPRRGGA